MEAQQLAESKILEDLVEYLQSHGIMAHVVQLRDLIYASTGSAVVFIYGGKIKIAGQMLAEDLASMFPPDSATITEFIRTSASFIPLADPEYREKILRRLCQSNGR